MNSFILISFLAFFAASSQAASLPLWRTSSQQLGLGSSEDWDINKLVDGLQNILISSEQTGLGLIGSSSSGDWDREINLETLGVILRIKYNDPAHPLKGGRAHVKFPVRRIWNNAPCDEMELDIVFNGGDVVDGLFDMKVDYKLIQKSMILSDRVKEGSIVIYRKLEAGLWKTRISVEDKMTPPRKFIDLSLESDHMSKVDGFLVYHDQRFDINMLRVEGQSITVGLVHNGVHYTARAVLDKAARKLNVVLDGPVHHSTLDIQLHPAGALGLQVTGDVLGPVEVKLLMQEDLKSGEVVIKHNNKTYVVVKVQGEAVMAQKYLPRNVNYVIKYVIGEAHKYQGKAKIIFNGETTDKKLLLSLVPESRQTMDLNIELDTANPMKKYKMEIKKDGRQVQMVEGEVKLVNDESQLVLESTYTLRQTLENPLYNIITRYLLRRPMLEAQSVMKVLVNKEERTIYRLWKKMRIENKFISDGKTMIDIEFDTTTPKKMLKIGFLPKYEDLIWKFDSSAEYEANSRVNVPMKFLHGDRLVHDLQILLDIKVNDENRLEIESLEKVVMTEESPLYEWERASLGRYFKNGERKMSVIVDKKNKSLKFIPKFMLKVETTLDSEKITHIEIDITKPVRMIKLYYVPDAFTKDYNFIHTWEIQGDMNQRLIKQKMELQRGGVSTHMYQGDIKLINNARKIEVELVDSVVQTEESPFMGLFRALYGRYFKNGERKVSIIVNKRNKSIMFIPKMVWKIEVTLDSQKVRHIEFDNTKPERMLKVFYAPDLFTKTYNYIHTWQIEGSLEQGLMKHKMELQRGEVSVFKYHNDITLHNRADKMEVEMVDGVVQTEASPAYRWGPFLAGKFYTRREGHVKITYDKQNRNVMMGKILLDVSQTINGARYSEFKVDTVNHPFTMLWYQPMSGHLIPSVRYLLGQDQMTVSAEQTTETELKIQTNLPQVREIKIITEGQTRKVVLNGRERAVVTYDDQGVLNVIIHRLNGEQLGMKLHLVSLEMDRINIELGLEAGVELGSKADRRIVTRLGWIHDHSQAKKKVVISLEGTHPMIGEYRISRDGDYQMTAPSEHKLIWRGISRFSSGKLATLSPIETDMEMTMDTVTPRLEARIEKVFAGRRIGLVLINGSISLISGTK